MSSRQLQTGRRRSSIDAIKQLHESDPSFQHTAHGQMLLAPMNLQPKSLTQLTAERAEVGLEIERERQARARQSGDEGGAGAGAGAHSAGAGQAGAAGDAAAAAQSRAILRGRRARLLKRRPTWLQPHLARPPTALGAQIAHYEQTMARRYEKELAARRGSVAAHRFGDFMNENKQRVRDIFDQFDTDGDGILTTQEFQAGLADLGLPMTEAEVARTLCQVNGNNDDTISFRELKTYLADYSRHRAKAPKEKLLKKRPQSVRVLTGAFWRRLGGHEDERLLRLAHTMVPSKQFG